MKVTSFILGVISLLIWWEAPLLTVGIVTINAILLLKSYDKSLMCNVVIGMCVIAVGLSIWNWDLHVGMYIIKRFLEIKNSI